MNTATASRAVRTITWKQRFVASLAITSALALGIGASTSVAHHGHISTASGTIATAGAAPGAIIAAGLAESVSETSIVAGRSRTA